MGVADMIFMEYTGNKIASQYSYNNIFFFVYDLEFKIIKCL